MILDADEGNLSGSFHAITGVKQGCLLSQFLFLFAIEWVIKKTTKKKKIAFNGPLHPNFTI